MPPRAAQLLRIRPVILAGSASEHVCAQTLTHVSDRNFYEAPLIITSVVQHDIVAKTLRNLAITDAVIIVEPLHKNTTPAMLMASFFAHTQGEEMMQLILPANAEIEEAGLFQESIKSGMKAAGHGFIVLFGVPPERATHYGYIMAGPELDNSGVRNVESIYEKPTADFATISGSKGVCGNSGIVLYHPRVFQGEMIALNKEYYHQCAALWNKAKRDQPGWGEVIYYHLPPTEYQALQNIAIDALLMAKTRQAIMIPCTVL